MKHSVLIRLLLLCLFCLLAKEQVAQPMLLDTIKVYSGDRIIIEGHSNYFFRDTLVVLPKAWNYKIQRNRKRQTQLFFENMENRSTKHWWTSKLFHLLVIVPHPQKRDTLVEKKAEQEHYSMNGRIIRNIRIKRLDPFGATVEDTTRQYTNWLGKTANYLHIRTKSWVVRQNLFFKKGDILNAYKISENEKYLRELPYIQDACIISKAYGADSVDLLVITKDLLPITFDGAMGSLQNYNLQINNGNFFGFGRKLNTNYLINSKLPQKFGFEGAYKIENIYGSFVSTEIQYTNRYQYNVQRLILNRNFITTEMKYAGNVEINHSQTTNNYQINTDTSVTVSLNYNYFSAWLGRSFTIGSQRRERLVWSVRSIGIKYLERPKFELSKKQPFANSTLWLTSLALSKRQYIKSKMIYSFGKTEDIPYGYLFEFISGFEYNELNNRTYFAGKIYYGNIIKDAGYIYFKSNFGTYLNNKKMEQGVYVGQINFYSNLFALEKKKFKNHNQPIWKFRNILKLIYTEGINRFEYEYLELRNKRGIRGMRDMGLIGNSRLTGSFENIGFSPCYLYGFNVALFSFVDLGYIEQKSPLLQKSNFYSGLGIGIRLRNENLIFKTIGIRLAFYPNLPKNSTPVDFEFTNENPLHLEDFDAKQPTVVPFQ